MTSADSSFRRRNFLAVLSLLLIDLLVYGPFLRSLGFSHDDWPVVSVYSLFGHDGVRTYFTNNRPLSGWLTNQLFTVLGVHPLRWHLAMLLTLALAGIATFFAFRALWPHRFDLAWLTAALVLLYPGFTQHSESLIFFPIIVSLLLFVLSLWATIASLNSLPDQSWTLTGLALVLALSAYGLVEYFLGLELFRLMVIAYRTRGYGVLRKAIAPYLVAWVPFVIYKGFIMHGNVGNSYRDPSLGLHQIAQHPLAGIIDRIAVFVHNIIFSVGLAWVRPIGPQLVNRSVSGLIVEYGLGLSVAAIALFSLRNFNKGAGEDRLFDSKLGLAIGAVLVSGIPLLISALRVQFDGFPSFEDRFALPFILSAAFLLAVLLTRVRSLPLIGGLLCLLTVFQVQTQLSYAHDWSLVRSLYWQEVWRVPMLKPGTAVYLDGTPATIVHSHNAGMLSVLYGAKPAPGTLTYFTYDLENLQQRNLKQDSIATGSAREFEFRGNVENSLVQWFSPFGVLHTVNGASDTERYSGITDALAPISAPDRVVEDKPLGSYGLLGIFGAEPKHDWRYYYQKAEMRRQVHDWWAVVELGDEAQRSGFQPEEGAELLPFIDCYARVGRYDEAERLTLQALAQSPELEQPLSELWNKLGTSPSLPVNVAHVLGSRLDLEAQGQ